MAKAARILEDVSKSTQSVAKNTFNGDILAQELLACYEPLAAALDSDFLFRMEANQDSGQEYPSVQDSQMRYEIGNMISNLWRQNYGVIEIQKKDPKTGKATGMKSVIDNGKQRLDASQARVEAMTQMETKEDFDNLHWLNVNQARFDARNNMMASLQAVYEHLFHESWKAPQQTEVTQTKKADLTEEQKAAAMQSLALAKSRLRA